MSMKVATAVALIASGVLAINQAHQNGKQAVPSDPQVFANSLQSKQDNPTSDSQMQSEVSILDEPVFEDQIGSDCTNNTKCDGSTFCCSKGRCVPGSICYKGQKQAYDHCDYGFECLSRCCSGNVCSPVIQCVETCKRNLDCANEPCCSFGYCTGSVSICEQAMKEDFDYCEAATECKSGICTNDRCTSNEIQMHNQISLNVMIILVFLMLIIVVTTCYFAKIKTDQAEEDVNNYRRSSRHRPSQTSDNNTEENQRQRHRHSRNQAERRDSSGSRSSDRLRNHKRSNQPSKDEKAGARKDEFVQKNRNGVSRRFSDSNSKNRTGTLSQDNLDRLSQQANSMKPQSKKHLSGTGHVKSGSDNRKDGEPALLFVEDEQMQMIMNQFGSQFTTTSIGASNLSPGQRGALDRDLPETSVSKEVAPLQKKLLEDSD